MKTKTKKIIVNLSISLITVLIIVGIDRLLLLYLKLPLWEWDEILHYKHRPNVIRYWEGFGNRPIIINEYGQHDYSFPVKKGENELRILDLGDSITMGHGVTRDETYSKYLEQILADFLKIYKSIQVINAGVQGYSTFQELEVLKRDLVFKPDIVTVGFCLNDITEPFVVNNNFGGTGLDYHKVTQSSNKILSYFLNETGWGRLIQEIRIRKLDAKQEKLAELFDVKKMLLQKDNGKYKTQWDFTLDELTKIYSLCKKNNIKVILVIFPYTFQFADSKLCWAQQLLINHATNMGVTYINLFDSIEPLLNYRTCNIENLFLDQDHFTPVGHQLVAKELSRAIIPIIKNSTLIN